MNTKNYRVTTILIFMATLFLMLFVGNNSRCASAASKGIPIDSKHFSEDMIRSCKMNYDTNKDGYLSHKEIKKIKSISIDNSEGSKRYDFRRIEYFTSLKK